NYGLRKNLDNEFLYRFGGGFGGAFGGGGSGGGGGNNLFLPERGTDSRNSYHNLRIGETWIVNTNLINEMHMQYSHENSTTSAISPGQSINVLDSFYGGGVSYSDPTQTRSDEIEVHNYLTYTHKRHTIKGGLQFTHLFNRDFNENNFLGTYTFANLNEYQTALANMGTPLARAQTFTISSGDPYLFYRRYTAGLFLQDDFRMSQRLTLSFGLREEFQSQLRDKNNWSPRFGFAWSPFSNRKTSIRGGAGLFYNRLSDGSYENTLRYDGVTQTNTIIRNALYPDPFAFDPSATSQISSLIPTVYKLDPNLKASYTINYNLSVEQQLPRGLIATLSFIHVDGVHLLRLRDINAPFPGTEQRPNPAEGSIYDYESTGRSTFDGFFFGFNRRISQRLTFFANYGLSWAHSDTGGLPANNYDLHSEWGRSSSDRRHNFSTIVNLNLPHGFRLNPVVNAFSGAPFNITTGVDENGDFQLTDRPAGINRNADLPASLYSSIPDRLICQPGTTPFRSAGGTACNTSGNPQ
ncbi:MAG: TonB-dependent receptor, partial [Blastocatellia bacterium]|nr:TonB-dependent receptor [Blastocatellia bacterium]